MTEKGSNAGKTSMLPFFYFRNAEEDPGNH